MPPTGILHTEMDEETLLELEIQQDLDRLNLDDGRVIADDDDDVEINNNEVLPIIGEDALPGSEEEGLPEELQDYISTIQKQRQKFEEELEECDTLIDTAIASARGEGKVEKAVVVYDEWKELEEEASRHGMTAEEYRKKLLQDIENEPFELEELDFLTDESEFKLPESQLDQFLNAPATKETDMVLAKHPLHTDQEPSEEDMMIEKALKIAHTLEATQRLNADRQDGEQCQERDGSGSVELEGAGTGQLVPVSNPNQKDDQNTDGDDLDGQGNAVGNSIAPCEPESEKMKNPTEENSEGTVAVIPSNPLLEFERYLREQFELAEQTFCQREQQLKQELEARREVEEKLMLAMEEHKLQLMHSLQQEEQQLANRKQESQKKLDQEIEKRQKVLEKELTQHEKSIATLTAQLEEDRYQLEKVQRAEEERLAQQKDCAAVTIQRCYKGYSVRKQYQSERQMLAEKKEQRKEEKTQQRIGEIEQQIQQRKEEEERKVDEARREKEEEERRIAEEIRKKEEQERLKREEEERKKKEEEEKKRRAEEEKKRKAEEEKRVKEEQEKKKQEEERQKREEEERQKREEEERQKREEEERQKREEEERNQKEEEERKRKEAEERKRKEEERIRKEEEERQKKEAERRKKQEEERKRLEEEKERIDKQRKEQECKTQEECKTTESRKSIEEQPKDQRHEETKLNENQNYENGHSVSPVVVDLEPVNANLLPSSLEERRLSWMKSCVPWSKLSNEPWKLKSTTTEKAPRRPASAKKLPPFPESAVLEAAQVASLRQVTTVELKDLPGHALSPLGTCAHLKHLTVTRCGLIALDGLSQCRHLQCLDVQDNLIEYVDLKDLGSLYTLNLSHNKLSSVHGLEGCSNLRWLDVSNNRLTKLAGLSPLRRLHTLQASQNQLVSTKGLDSCPTLQQLDLSANYLTSLQGLEKLALLTSLNVASNNLTQMPPLDNNVLLQELVLRENSIGPDLDLSAAWLPLLFNLDLSQNIIEELTGSAAGLFVLKRLDLAVNQITDISSFLPALSHCPRLEDLSLQGNAVLDEENLRENVKNSIACLLCLNGETLRSQMSVASAAHPTRCFEILCMNQLQLHRDLRNAFDKECRSIPEEGKTEKHHICDTYFKFCDKSFKMAVEHRYVHEYGELSPSNIPNPPQTPKGDRPPSARTPRVVGHPKNLASGSPTSQGSETTSHRNTEGNFSTAYDSVSASVPEKNSAWIATAEKNGATGDRRSSLSPVLSQKEKFDLALKAEANNVTASRANPAQLLTNVGDGAVSSQSPSEGWGKPREEKEKHRASLQVVGDAGRQPMREQPEQKPQLSAKEKFERALAGLPSTPSPLSPVAAPPSHLQKDHGQSGLLEKKSDMSLKKQGGVTADLVGDLMMSETAGGLSRSAVPNKFMDDDDGDLDDLEEMMEGLQFDIDGFLDLDQFDFDEDFLEKGWRPEDTPQMPQNYPVLGRIPSSNAKPPLPPVHNPHSPAPPPPPGRPAQAWRNADTPLSDIQTRVPPLRPPSSVGSGEDSQAITTGRARKEERLAEEWGFKDSRTAELMMQRANKMKHNADRRRKLSKLDPQQRLRLFRKLEEVKGVRAVRPPPPRVLPRKEYFQAREEEALQRDMEKQMEHRTKAGRTFEWLHTQVGEYDVSSSRINAGPGGVAGNPLLKTASDSQLSHHGSPSPHGYSPMSMEIESASSLSHHQPAGRQQRHSLPGEDLALTGHSPMLPPIKTGSGTSQRSREREKMSWRTEPVEKSGGWGGGKKRLVRK